MVIFLFGLGCLVVLAWAMAAPAVLGIALLGSLAFVRKYRQQNRHSEQPSLTRPEIQERFGSPQTTIAVPPAPAIPRRRVVALRQPVSTRVRLPSSRHQPYI